MRLLLLIGTLYLFLSAVNASELENKKLVRRLQAPRIVDPRDDLVVLWCDYDLEGKELYSVNWYKNTKMLYRFMPSMTTKGTSFPNESDVNVSIDRSNGTHLVLRGHRNVIKNMAAYQGTYLCEVSTEQPFLTDFAEANITTGIVPRKNPALEGVAPNYQVGEQLDAKCTSPPSAPPAELTFYLNNKKIKPSNTRKETLPIGEAMASTVLSLSMRLDRSHFTAGSLSLSCRSTLPGIKLERDYRTEQTAALAANNQRLAQEPPKNFAAPGAELSATLVLLLLLFGKCLRYEFH